MGAWQSVVEEKEFTYFEPAAAEFFRERAKKQGFSHYVSLHDYKLMMSDCVDLLSGSDNDDKFSIEMTYPTDVGQFSVGNIQHVWNVNAVDYTGDSVKSACKKMRIMVTFFYPPIKTCVNPFITLSNFDERLCFIRMSDVHHAVCTFIEYVLCEKVGSERIEEILGKAGYSMRG